MKLNKFWRYCFVIAVIGMVGAVRVSAQNNGLYSPANIQNGGTIVVPASSTNVFWTYQLTNGVQNGVISTNTFSSPSITPASNTNLLTLNVPEYDYCGFTWSYSSGSNATIQIFKSFDFGNTFEANPTFSYSGPTTASSAFLTNAALDIHGVTTLGFVIQNRGTLGLTNHLSTVNLKSQRTSVQPAGISTGTSPGTPIHVPNFN